VLASPLLSRCNTIFVKLLRWLSIVYTFFYKGIAHRSFAFQIVYDIIVTAFWSFRQAFFQPGRREIYAENFFCFSEPYIFPASKRRRLPAISPKKPA
jgi:hypothetical protein